MEIDWQTYSLRVFFQRCVGRGKLSQRCTPICALALFDRRDSHFPAAPAAYETRGKRALANGKRIYIEICSACMSQAHHWNGGESALNQVSVSSEIDTINGYRRFSCRITGVDANYRCEVIMTQTKSPSKYAIRKYLEERSHATTPPPSLEEIRRQLGWQLRLPTTSV